MAGETITLIQAWVKSSQDWLSQGLKMLSLNCKSVKISGECVQVLVSAGPEGWDLRD